ncbi:MAG: CHASE2 domain-containing protein, partial [Spirochaetes bacterium]|nr:CHASE2 domain-containing protein [Spirochaetota bacterium]
MQFSSNKKINKIIKKIISAFIIAMISLSICFVFFQVEPINVPGKTLQNIVYDNFFRLINDISKQDKSKTDDVIIVAIDDASLKNFQEKKHILWPWPRNIYAIISQHLINEGAKAVVFDVIFNNPDIDRVDTYGEDNDLFFYSIIKNTGKVILPFNIDNKLETDNMLDVVEIENVEHFKNIKEYKSIIFPPYELFTKNNTNFGFVDIEAELDGVIREYFPFVKIKDKCYPSLATTTYLLANKKRMPENMFLNKNGSFKINWYGPGGVNKTFAYSPVLLIISDFINKRRGLPLDIPEGAFKDKVIFIGGTARGLLDMKSTPFSKDEAYPGVEIHATAYLNMVQKSEIKSLSPFLEFSIYFIIIFILLFFGVKTKAIKKYSIIFFLSMIIIFISQFFIFNYFKIMTQTAFVIVAFLIAYLITQVYNYITEGRTSNMIKNALSSYLSPELA